MSKTIKLSGDKLLFNNKKILVEGDVPHSYYAVCSTSASVQDKVITIENFKLEKGTQITIRFENGNSVSAPRLKINNEAAKVIRMRTNETAGGTIQESWETGDVRTFVYDNYIWYMIDFQNQNSRNIVSNTNTSLFDTEATNGNVRINHIDGEVVTSSHLIKGTGGTTVTSDSAGNITINSEASGGGDDKFNQFFITETVDFDTLTTTGIYHVQSLGGNNQPRNSNGTLFVEFNVEIPYQVWMSDNGKDILKRMYQNSAWGEWSYVINNGLFIPYKALSGSGNTYKYFKLAKIKKSEVGTGWTNRASFFVSGPTYFTDYPNIYLVTWTLRTGNFNVKIIPIDTEEINTTHKQPSFGTWSDNDYYYFGIYTSDYTHALRCLFLASQEVESVEWYEYQEEKPEDWTEVPISSSGSVITAEKSTVNNTTMYTFN